MLGGGNCKCKGPCDWSRVRKGREAGDEAREMVGGGGGRVCADREEPCNQGKGLGILIYV